MIAHVGPAPELWPVRIEQHETYGRVHQYAIGRYLITLPAHYKAHELDTSFSYVAKLTVREVKWPAATDAESGPDILWKRHIEKLEERRSYDAKSGDNPYYKLENITVNGYPTRVSFYYDKDQPAIVIFGHNIRQRVDVHYLVDYGQHGVWFYDGGFADDKPKIEAGLVALVKEYEPYPKVGQATVKPGAYHMRRGVLNRPFTTGEQFETRFSGKDEDGQLSFNMSVDVKAEKFGKERYEHVPALYSDGRKKILRYQGKTAINCNGSEIIAFGESKMPNGIEGILRWWCSEEGYEVGYPDIKLSARLVGTKNLEAQLSKWDFAFK